MLIGLTNFSVHDFMKLFDFLLQQAKANALDTETQKKHTLEQVKTILKKAVSA